MHSFSTSKLAKTLRLLHPEEFKSFGQWLASPWCNSNKSLLFFYKKIKGFYPDFDDPRCNKERLFKQLYPNKEFKVKVILTLMSELYKQAERFIIQLQLEKDDNVRGKLIEEAYLERNSMERHDLMVRQRMEQLEEKKVLTQKDKLELYFYYEGLYHQASSKIRHQPTQEVLYKMNFYLDRFYALGKHRLWNEVTEREKAIKGGTETFIDAKVLASLREKLQDPILDLYALKKELINSQDEVNYLSLKKRFVEQVELLSLKDQKIIFYSLVNVGLRLDYQGIKNMVDEVFTLYKMGLDRNWLVHGGRLMTERSFSNIIVIANRSGNTSFTKEFIEHYTSFLEKEIQEDARTWGGAHTDYYQGNYSSVIDQLRDYVFKTHIYNFQGRFLLLKSYFDIFKEDDSYSEYFQNYILATEKFYRRDKLISEHRMQGCLNFLRFLRKLILNISQINLDKANLLALKKEILVDDNLPNRKWLISKIEEIGT